MPSADPEKAPTSDWARHQRIIAGFEAAWKRGERPKIGAHLPVDEPRKLELLVELAHADLEFRIKSGESARVEEYLRKYPDLRRARSTVIGLIRAEYAIRRRREPGLKLDRYRRRFPEYLTELETPFGEASTLTAAPDPATKLLPDGPSTAVAEPPLPRRLGKFELREKLGSGSFGVVYRAWDTVMHREVAIKVPHPEAVAAKGDLRTFLREARNAVELRHPHIVAILDAGPIDGTDCVVRAYIEGITLAERLREGPFTPEESAALLSVVADAIEHAHQNGIIHRDLKPSNILLDLRGLPHVSDFGLAKREEGDTTLSPAGSPGPMIGTPAYMSPEQVRGESYRVDPRSDVYSLGVVLYEVLTGALPFRGRGRMLQVQIQEAEPLPPRSLNDEVPLDLETICLKALAKDPLDRYQTARSMAEDLASFLKGEPVEPRSKLVHGRSARPGRWSARAAWSLAIGLVAAVALASTTTLWLRAEARRFGHSRALDRAYRATLDLARSSDRAWGLARDLAPSLEGDPSLVEVAADGRLRLAERAEEEGSDLETAECWLRAVWACEVSLLDRPDHPPRVEDLAGSLAKLGVVQARLGRRAEARTLFDRSILVRSGALKLREGQIADAPENDDDRLSTAEALLRLSEVQAMAGEPTEIRQVELIALELSRGDRPPAPPTARRLARLMLDLADRQLREDHHRRAEDSASRSLRLVMESGPADASAQALAARACLAMARAARALGRDAEAIEKSTEAVRRFEAILSPEYPAGRLADRRGLGEALFESGCLLDRPGDRPRAIEYYGRALRVRLDLDRDYPDSHATLSDLAEVRAALARIEEAEAHPARSMVEQLRAVADQARAVALAPGDPACRRRLRTLTASLVRMARDAPSRWRGFRSGP